MTDDTTSSGRASIWLYTPDRDGVYTHREIGRGLRWGEARDIVLNLIGDQPYNRDTYMGEYYSFGQYNPKARRGHPYYHIFDPHPEVDPNGSHRRAAPERWVAPEVQS